MIIAPTPPTPRSPVGRALRMLGMATPVALLAIAVGAGVLGQRPTETAIPPAPAASLAQAATAMPASPAPTDSPAPAPAATPVAPPDEFDGIPVSRYTFPPSGRDRGGTSEIVALSGRLLLDEPTDPECGEVQEDPFGPWCARRAWLSIRWSDAGVKPPDLALRVPVGVRMPDVAAGSAPVRRPLVLVLARWLTDDEACLDRDTGCLDELVVERFAWSGGARVAVTPVVDPRLPSGGRPDPFAGLDEGIVPLSAMLARPDDLREIEPAAAEAAGLARAGDPVWYVRFAMRDRDGRPGYRWAVLAERDLRVLGAGPPTDEARGDRAGPG